MRVVEVNREQHGKSFNPRIWLFPEAVLLIVCRLAANQLNLFSNFYFLHSLAHKILNSTDTNWRCICYKNRSDCIYCYLKSYYSYILLNWFHEMDVFWFSRDTWYSSSWKSRHFGLFRLQIISIKSEFECQISWVFVCLFPASPLDWEHV